MAVGDYALAGGSGALSGAGTGAAIGTAVGPGVLVQRSGPGSALSSVVVSGYWDNHKPISKPKNNATTSSLRQTRRGKNLAAKQRSVERRSIAQNKEASARAAKEGRDLDPPRVGGSQFALIQSMAVGSGSPFDSFIQRTYGRSQTSDPTV
jgi:hypothetical protein